MHYRDSILGTLLKAVDRSAFQASVRRHDAERYDKSFSAWNHLTVLIYAQLSGVGSLRALEAGWNANAHHHYHLGSGPVRRSTLADANQRRPPALFAEVFAQLSAQADRRVKREGAEMIRLIDSSPIELDRLCAWADWNGRTFGLKLHVVYDPNADHPRQVEITPATVNDVVVGRALPVEPGATYVFDKGYCDYAWWGRLDATGCRFVTRPKSNVRLAVESVRAVPLDLGDGFVGLDDAVVRLNSQGKARLPVRLRRVRGRTADARVLTLISNDWGAARFDETPGCGRLNRNRRSLKWTRNRGVSPRGRRSTPITLAQAPPRARTPARRNASPRRARWRRSRACCGVSRWRSWPAS